MFSVTITDKGGQALNRDFESNEVTIGRVQGNDIILPKGNVSKRHSRIVLKDGRFIVVDLKSTNGTYVNGRRITSPLVVKPGDKIYIGDFVLTLDGNGVAVPDAAAPAEPAPPPAAEPARAAPARNPAPTTGGLPPSSLRQPAAPPAPSSAPIARVKLGRAPAPPPLPPVSEEVGPSEIPTPPPPEPAPEPTPPRSSSPSLPPAAAPLPEPDPAPPATAAVVAPPVMPAAPPAAPPAPAPDPVPAAAPAPPAAAPVVVAAPPAAPPPAAAAPGLGGALAQVLDRTASRFDLNDVTAVGMTDPNRRKKAEQAIKAAISALGTKLGDVDKTELTAMAVEEAVGLGPVGPLLERSDVREIVIEGGRSVLADFGNGLQHGGGALSGPAAALTVAHRLAAISGRSLDPASPIVEFGLPAGGHVTVIQPPVAVQGAIIEIKRGGGAVSLADLTADGRIDSAIAEVLERACGAQKDIWVCGARSAGLHRFVSAIANTFDGGERVISVEQVPNLAITHPRLVSLASGDNADVAHRSLIQAAARMGADRLVICDVGPEDVYTTLSATAGRAGGDVIGLLAAATDNPANQLRSLAQVERSLSGAALDALVPSACNLVVQLSHDGKCAAIHEVTGGSTSTELFGADFASSGSPSF